MLRDDSGAKGITFLGAGSVIRKAHRIIPSDQDQQYYCPFA